jgi:hypothetical protein
MRGEKRAKCRSMRESENFDRSSFRMYETTWESSSTSCCDGFSGTFSWHDLLFHNSLDTSVEKYCMIKRTKMRYQIFVNSTAHSTLPETRHAREYETVLVAAPSLWLCSSTFVPRMCCVVSCRYYLAFNEHCRIDSFVIWIICLVLHQCKMESGGGQTVSCGGQARCPTRIVFSFGQIVWQ